MTHLFLLLFIPLSRFLININNWFYLKKVIEKHDLWLEGESEAANENKKKLSKKAADWIQLNTSKINKVVVLSGRGVPLRTYMDQVGYNYVQEKSMNLLDNLLFKNSEVLGEARTILKVSKGHFFTNAMSSLNPIFWIETIFFLPKAISQSLGIEVTTKLTEITLNLLQILWWLSIIIVIIFKPELLDFVVNLKSK